MTSGIDYASGSKLIFKLMADLSPMEPEVNPILLKNEVHIAVAGKSGGGKSTLVRKLLGVEDTVELSAEAITTENKTIRAPEKNGISLYITDTVGLLEEKEKEKSMRKLAKHASKQPKVDLLIYCLSIAPSSKFADRNPAIMQSLQQAYGSKIWENCIIALTFSNHAWERCGKKSKQPTTELTQVELYNDHINSYITKFKKELKKLKVAVDVQPAFDFRPIPARTILAIPAGDELDDEVIPGFEIKPIQVIIKPNTEPREISLENWRDILFHTAVLKCNCNTQKNLLLYKYGLSISKIIGYTAFGGIAGAVIATAVPAVPFVILIGAGAGTGLALLASTTAIGLTVREKKYMN